MSQRAVWWITLLLASTGPIRAAQSTDRKVPAPTVKSGPVLPTDDKTVPLSTVKNSVYLIGPEDVLDVSVWKEPDVSRVVTVRPDGQISLPLINDIQAAGLSPEQLASTIAEKLRKFVNEPQVTVIVTAMNSQRVFVIGEVLRAGAFPLLPGMTVLQALGSAGGFTTFADVKKIHIMRVRDGKKIQFQFNYREVLKGNQPERNINLEPGDTIVVP